MTIKEWLIKHNVQYGKNDVAPWGSYTLTISFDGTSWLVLRRFGRAFELEDAAEFAFKESHTSFTQDIINWMGVERYDELKTILESAA